MAVLIKPLVTEKMSLMNDAGKYGFIVDSKANKIQIKNEIEKVYGVTVESVNTMIQIGKSKVRQTKSGVLSGKSKSVKKAVVKVADGDIIDFYSGI